MTNCCPTMPVAPRMPTSTLRETTINSFQLPIRLRAKKNPPAVKHRRVAESRFAVYLSVERTHTTDSAGSGSRNPLSTLRQAQGCPERRGALGRFRGELEH